MGPSWRWLVALLVATALVLVSPRAARAQFLPASDVYKEVSELIEDLIRAEVGKSVAKVIDQSLQQRYFKETAKRLRSTYWGALDATLERDLIELLVDYAYFTATRGDASGQAFWNCVRASAAEAKDCGFVSGKTLFETHCPPTAASLACDFAQTLSATLERKEEVARSSSVQLFGDLLLSGHLGDPKPEQFVAFRERLRAWMADPDGARKQIDQLALEYGISKLELQKVVDCAPPLEKDAIFDRTSILACFGDERWSKTWDELAAVHVVVGAAARTQQSWSVKTLSDYKASSLPDLLDAQARRICAGEGEMSKAAALLRETTESAQQTLRAAQVAEFSKEVAVGALASRLKTWNARLAETRENPGTSTDEIREEISKMTAQLAESRRDLEAAKAARKAAEDKFDQANKSEEELQKKMKGYFESLGVDCGSVKPRFLKGVTVSVTVGDLELEVDPLAFDEPAPDSSVEPNTDRLFLKLKRMNQGLAFAGTNLAAVHKFEQQVAALTCEGCSLRGSVALLGSLRRASNVLMSLDAAGRDRLFSDLASVAELARALGAKHEHVHMAELLAPVLRAARRKDYRQMIGTALDQLWPDPTQTDESKSPPTTTGESTTGAQSTDDDQIYKTFFKTFSGFLLDSERGTDTGKGNAVAFREAAKDVLIHANKRGIPAEGKLSGYPISVSLRQSWNRTYPDGHRTLASIDGLSARVAFVKYAGIGGSAFDGLEPFQELALRDQDVEYDRDGLVAVNLIHPRFFVWLAVPEFSRFLALDAAFA
jgi:hypothetical protein